MTGQFQGSYRVNLAYQSEDRRFGQTPFLSADVNFRSNTEQRWFSLGFEAFQDRIGTINQLQRFTAGLTGAVHILPYSWSGWGLNLGMGVAYHSENYSGTNAVLEEDIIYGTTYGQTLLNGLPQSKFLRVNFGLHLSRNFEDKSSVIFGSALNVYSPTGSTTESTGSYGSVLNFYSQYVYPVNDEIRIIADLIGINHRRESLIYLSAMGGITIPNTKYDLFAGPIYKTNQTWGAKILFSSPHIDTSLEYLLGGAQFGNTISLTFAYSENLYKKIKYEPIYICPTY